MAAVTDRGALKTVWMRHEDLRANNYAGVGIGIYVSQLSVHERDGACDRPDTE